MSRNEIAGSYSKSIFSLKETANWKKLPNCLPKSLYYLSLPPTINVRSFCYTSLPAFDIGIVLDLGRSSPPLPPPPPALGQCNRYVLSCFNLCLPDDIWCTSFHMLICHLSIFLGEVSVKFFGLFLKLDCLLLSFKSPLCILDNNLLSFVSSADIFS